MAFQPSGLARFCLRLVASLWCSKIKKLAGLSMNEKPNESSRCKCVERMLIFGMFFPKTTRFTISPLMAVPHRRALQTPDLIWSLSLRLKWSILLIKSLIRRTQSESARNPGRSAVRRLSLNFHRAFIEPPLSLHWTFCCFVHLSSSPSTGLVLVGLLYLHKQLPYFLSLN